MLTNLQLDFLAISYPHHHHYHIIIAILISFTFTFCFESLLFELCAYIAVLTCCSQVQLAPESTLYARPRIRASCTAPHHKASEHQPPFRPAFVVAGLALLVSALRFERSWLLVLLRVRSPVLPDRTNPARINPSKPPTPVDHPAPHPMPPIHPFRRATTLLRGSS